VAGDRSAGSQLEQWVSLGATIVAPVTVLGALLFYFGYVSSASEYAYFGINVDTVGLSTQSYIMRSPQTLLVPLLVLTLISAGFLTLNSAIRRRITSAVSGAADAAEPDAGPAQRLRRIRHRAERSRIPGIAILTVGVLFLFTYSYMRDWAFYGLVTPLLIGIGAAIIAYASRIMIFLQRLEEQHEPAIVKEAATARATPVRADGSMLARRTAGILVYVVIAASIFWATATVAQWSGRGLAEYAAIHFDTLPSVILDTKEQLFLRDPGVEVTQLPPSQGQVFHYRYRGLRLLLEGPDRMFLVPDYWSPSDSTLIVPLDDSVRVQFQFQNQAPLRAYREVAHEQGLSSAGRSRQGWPSWSEPVASLQVTAAPSTPGVCPPLVRPGSAARGTGHVRGR
jgi:hypothetical protein